MHEISGNKKEKKNVTSFSSAELARRVVKVKSDESNQKIENKRFS